jgi:hypothetical protein
MWDVWKLFLTIQHSGPTCRASRDAAPQQSRLYAIESTEWPAQTTVPQSQRRRPKTHARGCTDGVQWAKAMFFIASRRTRRQWPALQCPGSLQHAANPRGIASNRSRASLWTKLMRMAWMTASMVQFTRSANPIYETFCSVCVRRICFSS